MIVEQAGNPKITVVVPTFNRAPLIGQTLDSLLDQKFTDFETIVVDDGSTDNTRDTIARHDLPTRYYYTSNCGPARARNIGMQHATGKYICYLDSDDLYYPFKLGLQADWLDDHPNHAMVYTEFSAFRDGDNWWNEFHLKKYHESGYRHDSNQYHRLFSNQCRLGDEDTLRSLDSLSRQRWGHRFAYYGDVYQAYLQDIVVFTNSMMFRRCLLEDTGEQSTRFGHFHDMEFALRLCRNRTVAFIDIPCYLLRYHTGQISTADAPHGAMTTIRKQQDLLRVVRTHMPVNQISEASAKSSSDKVIARLCRAAAVPLIAFSPTTKHQKACYPKRARVYLRTAARRGYPMRILTLISYAPEIVRRIYFRLEAIRSILTRRYFRYLK